MKTSCLALIAMLMAPAVCRAQKSVIFVRHAERTEQGELTAEGISRSNALARMLKDAGVTHIVRSDTNRTRDTAKPLAQSLKITALTSPADRNHVANAYAQMRGCGDSAVILYVGHTDTIGPLMKKFGHAVEVTFAANDYDNLFVLVPKAPEPVVVRLHFPKE